jgi:peptidoglycan/xylan/chitin deacetylase (PgdA/CDA1 family)
LTALILTYHGIERSSDPLFVEPELFAAHLDCIAESGVSVLTVTELVRRLESKDHEAPAVAITFDDGLTSVALDAAPLLHERGFAATVFCVGGYLGRTNDWPSRRLETPVRDLASAADLAQLAAAGWEIGSHSMAHAPLVSSDNGDLHHQIVRSKHVLEQAIGVSVRSFAYPYGAGPTRAAQDLVRATYEAGCSTRLGYVVEPADRSMLPRIDAYYVRRPELLRAALEGSLKRYLATRRTFSRLRRLVRSDYDLARRG